VDHIVRHELSSVSEDAVHDILRRAVALDADAADRMPIERLRSLAQEIGISDDALDAALAEFDRQGASVSASHPGATAQVVVMVTAVAGVVVGAVAPRRREATERDDRGAHFGSPLEQVSRRLTAMLRRLVHFGMSIRRGVTRPSVLRRSSSLSRQANHAQTSAA
jgi:hypothetical protein